MCLSVLTLILALSNTSHNPRDVISLQGVSRIISCARAVGGIKVHFTIIEAGIAPPGKESMCFIHNLQVTNAEGPLSKRRPGLLGILKGEPMGIGSFPVPAITDVDVAWATGVALVPIGRPGALEGMHVAGQDQIHAVLEEDLL